MPTDPAPNPAAPAPSARGHLVVIGGAESKERGGIVLSTFGRLAGGRQARITVVTTASNEVDEKRRTYGRIFGDLGAERVDFLTITSRGEANDPGAVATVYGSTGVFMTGGDQSRLTSILGGSEVAKAMHRAHKAGLVIGGTSAGAAAISEHMIVDGGPGLHPRKQMHHLAPGLGLLKRVVVDQHFLQRQRLGRLLSVVAQNPFVLGVGIDEDTAIVVCPDSSFQVVGSGAVTVLDGREIDTTNVTTARPGELLAVAGMRLHMLPAGFAFRIESREALPATWRCSCPAPTAAGHPARLEVGAAADGPEPTLTVRSAVPTPLEGNP